MPRLTVLMVRTALLEFGLGFTLGMLMLFNKGIPFDPLIWRLLNPHMELLLFGWVVQLAMGVAFWIMPRFAIGHRYGREPLGWIAYTMLNAGLIAFIFSAWSDALELPFIGRGLELGAVVCFAVMMWPRIKAFELPPTN